MNLRWVFVFVLLISNAVQTFAGGEETAGSLIKISKKHISFSMAMFDVLQQDKPSLEGRLEIQGSELTWIAKPFVGIMTNTDGALHFYSGFALDIPLVSIFYISPSLAPGIYYKSKSKDLSLLLEFRSQLELGIVLDNDLRVGLSFNHISNASLGKINPGVESVALTYYFSF